MAKPITRPTHLLRLLRSYRQEVPISDSSASNYRMTVRLAIRFCEADGCRPTTSKLFAFDRFIRFSHWLRTTPDKLGRMRKGRTVNGHIRNARTLWAWAHDQRLTRFPCPARWKACPEEKEPPTAWSLGEMRAILDHVACAPRIKGWSPAHWQVLIQLLWETGARIDAMLACRCEDLRNGRLCLAAANDKELSGATRRLSGDTLDALARLQRLPEDNRLLPWPRSMETLRRHFKRILKAAGLQTTRRDLFHKLRRTHATHLWVATGSAEQAQRSLNHRHLGTTVANYLDATHLPDLCPVDVLPQLK